MKYILILLCLFLIGCETVSDFKCYPKVWIKKDCVEESTFGFACSGQLGGDLSVVEEEVPWYKKLFNNERNKSDESI